jgi:hypothetical protein
MKDKNNVEKKINVTSVPLLDWPWYEKLDYSIANITTIAWTRVDLWSLHAHKESKVL